MGLWSDLMRDPEAGLRVTPMEAAMLLVALYREELYRCVDVEPLRDVLPDVVRLLRDYEVTHYFEYVIDLLPDGVHELVSALEQLPAPARRRMRPEHLRPLLAHRDPDVRLFALQYLGTLSPRAGAAEAAAG